MSMDKIKSQQKDLELYETLQKEYKKLLAEYEEIKLENPQNPILEKKVEQLTEKQKALEITLSRLS